MRSESNFQYIVVNPSYFHVYKFYNGIELGILNFRSRTYHRLTMKVVRYDFNDSMMKTSTQKVGDVFSTLLFILEGSIDKHEENF